jgi:hypothetical protein
MFRVLSLLDQSCAPGRGLLLRSGATPAVWFPTRLSLHPGFPKVLLARESECAQESSWAVRQGRFQLGVVSCAPSFHLLLRPRSIFLWLVLGLEHQVALLFLTTLFAFWPAPREVFRSWFSSALWESAARVHHLDSAARSQLPPSFSYPAVVLLVSFLATGITWFCVSAPCSCKSSFCFESVWRWKPVVFLSHQIKDSSFSRSFCALLVVSFSHTWGVC